MAPARRGKAMAKATLAEQAEQAEQKATQGDKQAEQAEHAEQGDTQADTGDKQAKQAEQGDKHSEQAEQAEQGDKQADDKGDMQADQGDKQAEHAEQGDNQAEQGDTQAEQAEQGYKQAEKAKPNAFATPVVAIALPRTPVAKPLPPAVGDAGLIMPPDFKRFVELEIKRGKTAAVAVHSISSAGKLALIAQLFGFGVCSSDQIVERDTKEFDFLLFGALLAIVVMQCGLICWLCCCRVCPTRPATSTVILGDAEPVERASDKAASSSAFSAATHGCVFLSPAGFRAHVSSDCSSLNHLSRADLKSYDFCRICSKKCG